MTGSISVIIPTFNRKHFLEKTLESIFKQSVQPFEIIVIDDHSTDGTISFLKDRFKERLIITDNYGKGPSSARNTGLSIATGDYIKFFDSDDLMTSNTLEVQSKILNQSSRGFVYGPYFYARETSSGLWESDHVILNYFPFSIHRPLWHYMIVDGLFITIPGMLFKKELLTDVGAWREGVTASEDWDYLFRISLHEPDPEHTNECAFLYRVHERQTTLGNLSDAERDWDKIQVLRDLYKDFIINDHRFSKLEKLTFTNKLYQIWKTTSQNSLKEKLNDYNSLLQEGVLQMQRIRNKAGRWRTGTDWQPCHGPYLSKEKTDYYLSLL